MSADHDHHAVPDYVLVLEQSKEGREDIPCPVCGSTRRSPVYEGVALRGNNLVLAMCLECTHMFITPRPKMATFKQFYNDDSYFHLCAKFHDASLDETMEQFETEEFWADRYGHGKRLHDRYFAGGGLGGTLGPGDVVFDFGCGDGAWLGSLREITGCAVDGEEISPKYAEVIKAKFGVDIFLGPVEETADAIADRYRGKVKLAIVSGSLQHMLDPMQCLRTAREILADDGRLYICNWSIFEHFMTSYQGDQRRLVGEIVSWEHLHYFHETAFRYMLAHAGFEVLDFSLESAVRPRHMDALARKTDAAPVLPSADQVQRVAMRLRALESATIAERLRVR
jgi:SAM-dependent methyltransferase